MANEHDQIRQRQLRKRQEQRQARERKKLRRRKLLMMIGAAALVVGLCCLVMALVRHANTPEPEAVTIETQPSTAPQEPQTVITLAFGGDLNVTDKTVAAGATGGSYDYTDVFMDVVPALAGADAAVLDLEGNLCGTPYGSTGTRAPLELATALKSAGVDMIQMANSSALNNGLIGLTDTLENLRSVGLEPVGAFASDEEYERQKGFTLRSINGVKVAFVSFTKGMDDLGLPAGGENRVNLLYTDYTSTYQDVDTEGITAILDAVALEKPDITVALLHWGSEYNDQISDSQKRIAKLMQENGVDAIIGTHSHYVQRVEYDPLAGTVVAWSLGDFLGDGDRAGTAYSIILELEITRDNQSGTARITDVGYSPIYTVSSNVEGDDTMKILRIEPAIAAYEANSIDKVSAEVYTAMKSALSKIQSRIGKE